MLMRFDPFREFDRLTQDRWSGGRMPVMPMDAYRQDDHFVVHFDLPGVDAESIDLTVEKNVLTVRRSGAGSRATAPRSSRPSARRAASAVSCSSVTASIRSASTPSTTTAS